MELREQLQRTLGNAYTLERELGGGGKSQVFVAEETALGRKVVVKVLPPGRTGDVNIERFKREIQVASRLQHAHNPDDPEQRLAFAVSLQAFVRLDILEELDAVAREADAAVVAATPAASRDNDWPYFNLSGLYSIAKRPQRARQWLNRYDAEIKDTVQLRLQAPERRRAEGDVLIAEGKGLEAVREYRAADRLPDGPASSCQSCLVGQLVWAFDAAKHARLRNLLHAAGADHFRSPSNGRFS